MDSSNKSTFYHKIQPGIHVQLSSYSGLLHQNLFRSYKTAKLTNLILLKTLSELNKKAHLLQNNYRNENNVKNYFCV